MSLRTEANQAAALCLGHASDRCSATRDVLLWLFSWDLSKRLRCALWRNLLRWRQLACLLHGLAKLAWEERNNLAFAKRTKHLLRERACQETNQFSVIIPKISLSSKMLVDYLGFSLASKHVGKLRAACFQASLLPRCRNTSGFASI